MRKLVIVIGMVATAIGAAGVLLHGARGNRNEPPAARAVLDRYCVECHNNVERTADIAFDRLDLGNIAASLATWEKAARKLGNHTMPPPEELQPSDAERGTLLDWLDTGIDAFYASVAPDPGRVTARRLNRTEYENTIRDLLGVDFRADDAFAPDDTVQGLDNIAAMLTMSPTLAQQYLTAAERIAARAVGGSPLPNPGLFSRRDRVRRVDANSIELVEIVDYDAEYLVRVNLVGYRGEQEPAVALTLSVDGAQVARFTAPVQITPATRQGGGTQRSSYEARVFLPANAHTFRADFAGDAFGDALARESWRNEKLNIFPDSIDLLGPFAPREPRTVSKPLLICDPDDGRACVARILDRLAGRAFRRPATDAEVAPFLAVYDDAAALGYAPRERLQFAVAAVLVAPQFLFRQEPDPPAGTTRRLSSYELASRLSYFLWSSMPDDDLLRLASADALQDDRVIRAQVRRMLADPKAAAFAASFAGQWLETRSLAAIARDERRFPEWDDELRRSMRLETELFFAAVLRDDRPIGDFIDGPYTYLNERLAAHYGIADVAGDLHRRVELDTAQRSGVFTQASVLSVTSYPNRTSVVLRGKYLLDNVLHAPPPGPPADVPGLDEDAIGTTQSLREQMEAHRTDAVCASCHVRMDPLGFALENYDATGKWRTADGDRPIDASGVFPDGRSFESPADLKALLRDNLPEFARGFSEKLLTYALGRVLETDYDRAVVREIVAAAAADEYRIGTLIEAVATSVPFRERSAPAGGQ